MLIMLVLSYFAGVFLRTRRNQILHPLEFLLSCGSSTLIKFFALTRYAFFPRVLQMRLLIALMESSFGNYAKKNMNLYGSVEGTTVI